MNDDIKARLALSMVEGVGAKRARQLLEMVENPLDIFGFSHEKLIGVDGIGETTAGSLINFKNWDLVERVYEDTLSKGFGLLVPEDSSYSERLKNIDYPPILLWYKGDVGLLNSAGIAVVGTRAPSTYGLSMTKQFTRELVHQELVIISGLARGIDTAAHKETLKEGGRTIAVFGSGLDRVYPHENMFLVDEIVAKNGLILSEYPPGTKPDYQNFPTRNRIVSGLSLGVLVVETDMEGGSMITAELAFSQNREVFVIPHALDNRKGTGCNFLIRNATGKMVVSVTDIISEFDWIRSAMQHVDPIKQDIKTVLQSVSNQSATVFEQLCSPDQLHFDELLTKTGMSLGELNTALLELEFGQFIKPLPGRMFRISSRFK
jgi:DNA processing protein